MPYSTPSRLVGSYPKLERTNANSQTLLNWLERSSHLIDGYIKDVVATVPVSPSPPMLIDLSEDLAYVMFLRRSVHEYGKEVGLQKMYDDAISILEQIRSGAIALVNSAGEVITLTGRTESPWSNVTGYHPTFSILDVEDSWIDPERTEDEEGIRD